MKPIIIIIIINKYIINSSQTVHRRIKVMEKVHNIKKFFNYVIFYFCTVLSLQETIIDCV